MNRYEYKFKERQRAQANLAGSPISEEEIEKKWKAFLEQHPEYEKDDLDKVLGKKEKVSKEEQEHMPLWFRKV